MRLRSLVFATLSLAALIQLAVGFASPPRDTVELRPYSSAQLRGWSIRGFAPEAEYKTVARILPPQIARLGSWLGSDATTGEIESPWIVVDRDVTLSIAGYPGEPGNELWLEVRNRDGELRRERVTTRAAEGWRPWRPETLPPGEELEARVVGRDGATGMYGWFAVTEPYHALQHAPLAALLRILLTLAAAVYFLLAPGLALAGVLGRRFPIGWLPLPGAVLLAAIGLLAWALGGSIPPHPFSAVVLGAVWIACVTAVRRFAVLDRLHPAEIRVLGVFAAVVAVAAAKATYSPGPPGELFGERIQRMLEVGDRSDARISFVQVQMIDHHFGPRTEQARTLFIPYTFSHRGPLAGLIAAPLVSICGATTPELWPDEPWRPFDPQGFAAYRLTMIVLAALSVLAVFSAAEAMSPGAGPLAAALVAVAPFFVHEVYFTWPKLFASTWVMLGIEAAWRRRPVVAGGLVALGYFCHPAAAFALPFVVLVLARPETRGSLARIVGDWVLCSAALLAGMLAWRLINRGDFHQDSFLAYAAQSNARPALGVLDWLEGRWVSVTNTLVPLAAFARYRARHSPPEGVVAFFFQCWTTLPFGWGLLGIPCLLRAAMAGWSTRRFLWASLGIWFLVFAVYWGHVDMGLMREGLHAWFLSLAVLAAVALREAPRRWRWADRILPLRGLEVLALLFVPAHAIGHIGGDKAFAATDAVSAAAMVLGVAVLAFEAARALDPRPA